MAGLMPPQMSDIVATTLRFLNKPNYIDLMSDLQEYVFTSDFLTKDSFRKKCRGVGIRFNVGYYPGNNAANVAMDAPDNPTMTPGQIVATAEWCQSSANWMYYQQELEMNNGEEEIVDDIEYRRNQCLVDKIHLMEDNFFGPPPSVSDNLTPWGLRTWIVKNASTGFNGGAPSGYTTIGLNPTTYPRFKNYTFQYTNITPDDFVFKLANAMRQTHFVNPTPHPDVNTGDKMSLMTNNAVMTPLEALLRASNDNLGPDILKYQDQVMIKGVSLRWVPRLDADTTNPIYGANKGTWKMYTLPNFWDRETVQPIYPGQHNTSVTWYDSVYNFVCHDRRRNFVGATGTSEPG